MDYKEKIKAHLDKMAEQDEAFAARLRLESKSLDECIKYIMSEARKKAVNGCACIDDEEVYGWAAHYYQEDSVKVDKSVKAKVTTSPEPKKESPKVAMDIKPIKAPAKSRKNSESKCVELDMFAGMF